MSALEPGQARIRHPDLDPDGVVVPASAVEHHKRAGWELVEGDAETWPTEARRFEGQDQVRIYHPQLDVVETVAASAVPEHRSRGWVLADQVEEERLEAKTVAELRERAKERGISPIPATKAELVDALNTHEQEQAGDEPAPADEEGEV